MNYYVGMDIGTSSLKSVLFDPLGREIKKGSYEYDIIVPSSGYAEENPLDFYKGAIETLKSIKEDGIKGIGLSGQMHGLIMLDKDDNILYNAIIWCDNRTQDEVLEIEKFGREKIRKITGNYPMPAFTLAKLLWVKKNRGDIYQKINKIMLPKDYIRYMLTGEFSTEYSDASGMQMMDLKAEDYSKEILDFFGIDIKILPPIKKSNEISGFLKEDIKKECGLKGDIFVAGGGGDQACGALGSGIINDGDVSITLGSSGVVFAPKSNISDISENMQIFHHIEDNKFHVMGVTNGCGNSLKWYRDFVRPLEKEEALKEGIDAYTYLTRDIDKINPGCNGLIYLPYILGERSPHIDTSATGSFIGLRFDTNRSMIVRSIIEGISYSMKDCYNLINSDPSEILITGGGAKNEKWCSILSSVLNKKLYKITAQETPALGAAILAMVAGGEYKNVKSAIDKIIKKSKSYKPNNADNEIYEKYFKVYQECYIQNKKIYEMTRRINK